MANTYSATLNGSSQWVKINTAWKPTTFTISAWIKPTAISGTQRIFTSYGDDLMLTLESTGKLKASIWDDTGSFGYENFDSTGTVSAGVWTFVAFTKNNTSKAWAFYIGTGSTADSSGTGARNAVYEASTLYNFSAIGSRTYGSAGAFFGGKIDDVRLWNTDRSGANLASDNSQELVGNETNLYGYYKFENNLNDSDDSPHNGTDNGTITFATDVPFPLSSSFFLMF